MQHAGSIEACTELSEWVRSTYVRRAPGEPAEVGSAVKGWSEVKCLHFFVDRTLVQTTSGNALKAVPSSKSDWSS